MFLINETASCLFKELQESGSEDIELWSFGPIVKQVHLYYYFFNVKHDLHMLNVVPQMLKNRLYNDVSAHIKYSVLD